MKTKEQKQEINREKNLHYPRVSFRVGTETASELKRLRGDKSWNLFFVEMIKIYKQSDRTKK